jgi:hypothetical protein
MLDGMTVEILSNGFIGGATLETDGYYVLVINREFGPFEEDELQLIGNPYPEMENG